MENNASDDNNKNNNTGSRVELVAGSFPVRVQRICR